MDLIPILLQQLFMMVLFLAVGYFLYKRKLVTALGCKELGNLLLYVVLPAAIINSYCVERTSQRVSQLLISSAASLAAILLSMLVSALLFRRQKIERFGVAFSNAGFMGIPIVSAVLGADAVFYISSFVALLNIFQWTYGVVVMTGSTDCVKGRKLLKNPILIAAAVGLLLFFLQPPLPGAVTRAVSGLAAMNGPVAMVILGIYLAQTDVKSIFTELRLYASTAVRLLLIPGLTAALLLCIPTGDTIRLAVLIAACAPIGSNVAIFAQIHQLDYTLAVREVCLSTLLSVISMPVVIGLFSLLL